MSSVGLMVAIDASNDYILVSSNSEACSGYFVSFCSTIVSIASMNLASKAYILFSSALIISELTESGCFKIDLGCGNTPLDFTLIGELVISLN